MPAHHQSAALTPGDFCGCSSSVGVSEGAYWCSWYFYFLIVGALVSILVIVVGRIADMRVFTQTQFVVMYHHFDKITRPLPLVASVVAITNAESVALCARP